MDLPIRRALLLVAALAVIAAACGGDEPADSTPATTVPAPTTAAPQAPATTVPAPTTAAPQAPATTEPAAAAAPSRAVEAGDSVSVHYVGTLDDGTQFDSSRDRGQPLSFVSSTGQMIPGFDAAVVGMVVGEVKTVRIEAADAYGEWTEDRVQSVDVTLLPEDVVVGDEVFASTGQRFVILEIGDTEARLDGNHELAGQALTFEIEVVSIGE